ncbi:unnamed protein product [Acanthoscelides obtectus]|uniref:Protein SERAC1 n=1 Tax=Acanthoscelides obtectus TaxID=200917 RepID=A0A9P0PFZ2_ACAOB|nr:unnamed protein product [Acanthoscelides obtectus]CAK1642322.1 Protein SERAC1 [Acanthoscelides obtectus]
MVSSRLTLQFSPVHDICQFRKLWLAVDLVARALLPSVTTVYYTLFRNPQTVVYCVKTQIFPALAAFLANSISRSLASVQKISLVSAITALKDSQHQTAAITNGEVSVCEEIDYVPEKTVHIKVLAEPSAEHCADVIFIHGLHGGLDRTWKQGTWRQDWHKLKHQTPVRRLSTGNLYVPPRQQSLKRTITGIYSKLPNKKARKNSELCIVPLSSEWEKDTDDEVEKEKDYSYCWPKDWIPQDCPNVRVLALNYTTDILWCPMWAKRRNRTDMVTRSQEMIDGLVELGVGKKPIVWVGHSKGGLYIKQILVNAWKRNRHRPEVEDLFKQSKSIMWYSVPHKGSSLADITVPFLRRSIELLEIQRNCDFVLDLHQQFLNVIQESNLNPDVFSFIETSFTLMSFIYLKIVPYDSAGKRIHKVYDRRVLFSKRF